MKKSTPLEIRFWRFVLKRGPDDCWLWLASKRRDGYGQIKAHGTSKLATRVSFELSHGSIDQNLCVLHTCDNPSCVNPAHLFQGTQADNVKDCISKNRRVPPWRGVTHCIHGHEFNEANTYSFTYKGLIRRKCRKCHARKSRMYRSMKTLKPSL